MREPPRGRLTGAAGEHENRRRLGGPGSGPLDVETHRPRNLPGWIQRHAEPRTRTLAGPTELQLCSGARRAHAEHQQGNHDNDRRRHGGDTGGGRSPGCARALVSSRRPRVRLLRTPSMTPKRASGGVRMRGDPVGRALKSRDHGSLSPPRARQIDRRGVARNDRAPWATERIRDALQPAQEIPQLRYLAGQESAASQPPRLARSKEKCSVTMPSAGTWMTGRRSLRGPSVGLISD